MFCHNSNNTENMLQTFDEYSTYFVYILFFINQNLFAKIKSHKSHFCTFFFSFQRKLFQRLKRKMREDKSVSLEIMYWTEEIKRTPNIFTLYLSIKSILICSLYIKYRRWKDHKKNIVRKHIGKQQQPVMNRHDDNDNWLTTVTPWCSKYWI